MGIYAGTKGVTVMRDGEKTFVAQGGLVPEFLKMSSHGLALRIKQGIVTVDWDEDDVLLKEAPIVPKVTGVVTDVQTDERQDVLSQDWWPIETTRGFTSHLIDPKDEGKFLCGRRSQQPEAVSKGVEAKECNSCRKRA